LSSNTIDAVELFRYSSTYSFMSAPSGMAPMTSKPYFDAMTPARAEVPTYGMPTMAMHCGRPTLAACCMAMSAGDALLLTSSMSTFTSSPDAAKNVATCSVRCHRSA